MTRDPYRVTVPDVVQSSLASEMTFEREQGTQKRGKRSWKRNKP